MLIAVTVVMKCCISVLQRIVNVIRMLVTLAHPPFDAALQLVTEVRIVMLLAVMTAETVCDKSQPGAYLGGTLGHVPH